LVVEQIVASPRELSPIASASALSDPSPASQMKDLALSEPMMTEPLQVTEQPKAEESEYRGDSGLLDSGIGGISFDSLEATRNVRETSLSKSDETENGESWSSVEEWEPQRPILDIGAREQTELTIETFWDVFNKRREELCRQRAAADRQATFSAPTSQFSSKQAASSSAAPYFIPQVCGNSHSRADDDEDDSRYPKRIRSELELPADRIENPRYSCPYRKHNRQRYNIHTHRTCALSWFTSIARLK
jgi:hypothetical protein